MVLRCVLYTVVSLLVTVVSHCCASQIIEIGEALSGFGTADFGERSNSSRAINTKDYAYLLKLYGETYWGLFRHEFIEGMPQVGLCVRQVRCKTDTRLSA